MVLMLPLSDSNIYYVAPFFQSHCENIFYYRVLAVSQSPLIFFMPFLEKIIIEVQ